MAVVSYRLARAAVVDWLTGALAIVAALLLVRYRVSSLWLILAGAAIGIPSVQSRAAPTRFGYGPLDVVSQRPECASAPKTRSGRLRR